MDDARVPRSDGYQDHRVASEHPRQTSVPDRCADIRAPLQLDETATAPNATQLRRRFHTWLAVDVAAGVVDELVLVVYEAIANVVEHAYSSRSVGPGSMGLHARRTRTHALITVSDHGIWRTPAPNRLRGRGIPLMRHLAQDLRIDRTPAGTLVRIRAHVEPDQDTAPK